MVLAIVDEDPITMIEYFTKLGVPCMEYAAPEGSEQCLLIDILS
jgi:hypothetical protein